MRVDMHPMRKLRLSLLAASTVAVLAAGNAAGGLPVSSATVGAVARTPSAHVTAVKSTAATTVAAKTTSPTATPQSSTTATTAVVSPTAPKPAASTAASKPAVAKSAPATTIANFLPVGLAAGDYLLSVQVTSVTTYPVVGIVFQQSGGVGPWDRVAQFTASTSGTMVQAQVRVTGPQDIFIAYPFGPATTSLLTFTPAQWGYVVRGPVITSAVSSSVRWHGVNADPDLPIPAGVQALATNTRANIVRVPVYEYDWLPFFTARYQASYRQQIIDTVNAITAAGMSAIVDLHAAGHDNPTFDPGYSLTGQLGPDQHSITFWQDAAGLWGNNPNVIFELFNEPQVSATDVEPGGLTGAQVWRDGGTLTAGTDTWTAPGMQQLADTVRATGADNLILVDGTDYAGSLLPAERTPVDGTNLAYAFHAYTLAGEDPTAAPAYLASDVAPLIDPAGRYRFAGLATEFGTKAQDGVAGQNPGSAFLTNTANWISSYGVGWVAWGWYPHNYDAYGMLWSFPFNLLSRAQTLVGLM
jgi:hypothetical protein